MKRTLALLFFLPLLAKCAQPNVPLYVHWDGSIAAPTQFLSVVFKAGAGISISDSMTNLTISTTGGGAASTNFVVAMGQDLTNLIYSIGANATNLAYSIGANTTNYANSLWTSLSNVDYTVFTVLSNGWIANSNLTYNSFLSSSNYAFSLYNGWPTNHSITLATNTTQANLDFSGTYQTVEVPDLLETNIVLVTTNLVAGREMWVNFQAPSCTYFVTITNTDGYAVHWNLNSTTNGFTSFAVTNGFGTELAIKCYSNNVIKAVYGHNL